MVEVAMETSVMASIETLSAISFSAFIMAHFFIFSYVDDKTSYSDKINLRAKMVMALIPLVLIIIGMNVFVALMVGAILALLYTDIVTRGTGK